jgi:hypothetical protein
LFRAGPSAKPVVMIDNPAGAVKAAPTPLTNRVAVSSLRRDDLEQRFPGLLDSVLRAAQA